jgi:CBS-domain-containing membrane protein
MKLKGVRELMLPLHGYAVVPEDTSLLGALFALDDANKKRPEGRVPYSAVLVVNKKDKIIGKLGHLAFLRGLEPGYNKIGDLDSLSRVGWSSEFISSMMDTMRLWKERFPDYVQHAKRTPVKRVMHPVTENIDIDAPISEAVHKLVMYQTLSLLVKEGDEVVGILRLADVFNEISEKMMLYAEAERETGESK